MANKVKGFLDERPERMATVLVPGRHKFDERHDISQWVLDRNAIGLGRVQVFVAGLAHEPSLGRSVRHGDAARSARGTLDFGPARA